MKKILITGASGFFGRSVIKSLANSSEKFNCICFYYSQKPNMTDSRFTWLNINLFDESQFVEFFKTEKPTHCLHLAWEVRPQVFWNSISNISWLNFSSKLFHAFGENGGQKFIGAGTLAEYSPNENICDELQSALKPSTLYGQTKKSFHEIILCLRDTFFPNIKVVWPRIGYFFGVDEPKDKFISKLIYKIQRNIPIDLASPNLELNYANVKYLGEIFSHLLLEEKNENLVFNLSSSYSISLKQIVDKILQKFGKNESIINYNAYLTNGKEVNSKHINTFVLENYFNYKIPHTFFEDLNEMMKINHESV